MQILTAVGYVSEEELLILSNLILSRLPRTDPEPRTRPSGDDVRPDLLSVLEKARQKIRRAALEVKGES